MVELSVACGCPEAVLETQRNQALGCLARYSARADSSVSKIRTCQERLKSAKSDSKLRHSVIPDCREHSLQGATSC
jgi:hypothetical protein